MKRLFTAIFGLFLLSCMLVLRVEAARPALYDVQIRVFSGNKTIMISAPHLGDKPTVEYFVGGTTDQDIPLRAYEFVGPWVVDVDWQAHHSMPKVTISPR